MDIEGASEGKTKKDKPYSIVAKMLIEFAHADKDVEEFAKNNRGKIRSIFMFSKNRAKELEKNFGDLEDGTVFFDFAAHYRFPPLN